MFSPFVDSVIVSTCINIMLAWSFYVPIAVGKLFAGQAGFMAIGAYMAAWCEQGLHVPYAVGLLLATLVTIPISWAIAALSLRLSGFALAIASLGFALVLQVVFTNADWAGGSYGVRGLAIDTTVYVGLGAVIIVGVLLAIGERSRHGLAMQALRSDDVAAASAGIAVRRYQTVAVVISGMIASLAGAFYAHYIGFVSPDLFGFALLVSLTSWVFFGGTTTYLGALFGATVLSVLPQVMSSLYEYRLIAYSVLVILVVRFLPDGLVTRHGVSAVVRFIVSLFRRPSPAPAPKEKVGAA